jgi:hypothetical protein
MANKDLKSNIRVSIGIAPKASTSTGTGSVIDLQGYDSAAVVVNFGAWTDGTHTPGLDHSVDGTTYTDAGTDSVLDGSFTAVSGTAGQNSIQKVGYKGTGRYIRPKVTVAAGTTGIPVSVNVISGHPALKPVT